MLVNIYEIYCRDMTYPRTEHLRSRGYEPGEGPTSHLRWLVLSFSPTQALEAHYGAAGGKRLLEEMRTAVVSNQTWTVDAVVLYGEFINQEEGNKLVQLKQALSYAVMTRENYFNRVEAARKTADEDSSKAIVKVRAEQPSINRQLR